MDILRRKLFPKQMSSPTVQRDLSGTIRVGKIAHVFPSKGICTIQWMDRPGYRNEVIITQGSPKEWHVPSKGDMVLVGFDASERARILRYINMGQEARITQNKSLPKLKEGEKLWEVGGSYLYLKANGDIILATLDQGFFTIENSSGTVRSETVNWKAITHAGTGYFGIIKRLILGGDGNYSPEIISAPEDVLNNPLNEYRLKLSETEDPTISLTGVKLPFIDICLGTYADASGLLVNKVEIASAVNPNKRLVARIKIQDGTTGLNNVSIYIDKQGRVSIDAKSINMNGGYVDAEGDWTNDIGEGLETSSQPLLGNKGQHAAREHDEITVPIGLTFTDADHIGLTNMNTLNLATLQKIAKAIMSPAGPCSLNPALLPQDIKLVGEITKGAENVYIGDNPVI